MPPFVRSKFVSFHFSSSMYWWKSVPFIIKNTNIWHLRWIGEINLNPILNYTAYIMKTNLYNIYQRIILQIVIPWCPIKKPKLQVGTINYIQTINKLLSSYFTKFQTSYHDNAKWWEKQSCEEYEDLNHETFNPKGFLRDGTWSLFVFKEVIRAFLQLGLAWHYLAWYLLRLSFRQVLHNV